MKQMKLLYFTDNKLTTEEVRTHNNTYPKGGVSCFADTFVQAESSVLRMKISGKNPAFRQTAKHFLLML